MTEAELDAFLAACPRLFHMTEREGWPSIRRHGLLSTTALLDRAGIAAGPARDRIEAARRPVGVPLAGPDGLSATIRDNGPMTDRGLMRALVDGTTPEAWYRLLNERCFFWTSRRRLEGLLAARPYRGRRHAVLTVEARPLVEAYLAAIRLSPINSGTTHRFPAPRGRETFVTIADCPWREWARRRGRRDAVVELAVLGGVPDAERFVLGVTEEGAGEPPRVLFER